MVREARHSRSCWRPRLCFALSGLAAASRRTPARRRSSAIAQMISDPISNPGYLAVDRGEALWSEKRGTKNVSLEALRSRPRRRQTRRRVRETAALSSPMPTRSWTSSSVCCGAWQNVQGLDTKDVIARRFSGPGRASDMEDLVAFIANKSNGMKIDVPAHPSEGAGNGRGRRSAVLPPRRRDGFLLRDLPRRGRQAHPPAGPAESVEARQDCAGNDGVAGRPIASRKARCARCSIGCGTAIASSAGRCRNTARTASRR